jgi:hypothetical protein
LGHEQLTLQLATEPAKGQEQDVGAPASASVAAPGASVGVEAEDAGGGDEPPQAATKIAVDAIAAQYPTTFLWLDLNMALFYPGGMEFVKCIVASAAIAYPGNIFM